MFSPPPRQSATIQVQKIVYLKSSILDLFTHTPPINRQSSALLSHSIAIGYIVIKEHRLEGGLSFDEKLLF
jgi:hypothetical protein